MATAFYDIETHQEEMLKSIIEAFSWLGLEVNITKVSKTYVDTAISCYQI